MGINPFNDDGEECVVQQELVTTTNAQPKIFLNKYRPKSLDDISLPEPLRSKIRGLKSIPNMLINGAPGIGKTCTVKQLAKKIYGKHFKEAVLELNASDNRGLDTINNSIIYFCRKKLEDDNAVSLPKLVIMDEADNITKKAQNMISNYMEEYSNNTTFVFTCNDSNKLIESIQSRCFIITFPVVDKKMIIDKLMFICSSENIPYETSALTRIAENSNGDMRQAIINLDVVCNGCHTCDLETVQTLQHQPHQQTIFELIKMCAMRDLRKAIDIINSLKDRGYCNSDIILNLLNVINKVNIDEQIRMKYINQISHSYINICNGIDSNLQLYGCLAKLVLTK